jgi:hypothetical protein
LPFSSIPANMVSACGFGVCGCCRSSGGGCGACAWGGIWGENDFFLLSEPPLRPLFPPNPDICCSVRGRFDAAQKEVGAWCFFLPRTSRPLPCPMPASLSNVLIPCPKYLFTPPPVPTPLPPPLSKIAPLPLPPPPVQHTLPPTQLPPPHFLSFHPAFFSALMKPPSLPPPYPPPPSPN